MAIERVKVLSLSVTLLLRWTSLEVMSVCEVLMVSVVVVLCIAVGL